MKMKNIEMFFINGKGTKKTKNIQRSNCTPLCNKNRVIYFLFSVLCYVEFDNIIMTLEITRQNLP